MSATVLDPEDVGVSQHGGAGLNLNQAKLFVGGLSSSTTKESLNTYFSQFGDVVDCVVMKNNETGKSRGFGFVTFSDPSCVYKALKVSHHELDGKKIDPKECTPRSMQKMRKQAGKCKIFLGGLPPNITEEAIRSGMSKFGKVDQVVIMYDQETKKCRGFGFLSFELEESIDQACAERYVIISGKQIECKKAEPRMNPKNLTQSYDLKNQNGFIGQTQYSPMTSTQQNNWSPVANHTLYGLQGSPFPNFSNYASPMVALNTTPPGYTAVQSLPYVQSYPANYGTPIAGYNYTPVPVNNYSQPNPTNSQIPDANGQNVAVTETGKLYGSNDYSQSSSLYGPLKTSYVGENATDGTYSTNAQGVHSASNYQRYHPYKA